MTGLEILQNAFFGFWYILGSYFIVILSLVWVYGIVLILVHLLTKK